MFLFLFLLLADPIKSLIFYFSSFSFFLDGSCKSKKCSELNFSKQGRLIICLFRPVLPSVLLSVSLSESKIWSTFLPILPEYKRSAKRTSNKKIKSGPTFYVFYYLRVNWRIERKNRRIIWYKKKKRKKLILYKHNSWMNCVSIKRFGMSSTFKIRSNKWHLKGEGSGILDPSDLVANTLWYGRPTITSSNWELCSMGWRTLTL